MTRILEHIFSLYKYHSIYIIVLILIFSACSKQPEEKIIAKVGDKTISLNEFIRRAEYTVRPNYCRNNTNVDKKIILNTLIAEKMFSIEAGDTNSFLDKDQVKLYLKGRKEQAMRQLLYNDQVKSKVSVDTLKIKKAYKYAGREYDISYVSIKDSIVAKQLYDELFVYKDDFEKILKENYNLKEIPNKKVTWNKLEHPIILEKLFLTDYKKGEVIGPVLTDEGFYMFIKINGWTNTPAISNPQIEKRFNLIKETYESVESKKIYKNYVQKIMKNKKLEFNKEVFFALTNIMAPLYMRTPKDKEEIFKKGIWDTGTEVNYREAKNKLEEIKNEKLLSIDGINWNVEKFLTEIKVHPLVFRNKNFSKSQFGEQFQLAILDMVKDSFLTKEAYAKKYDESLMVIRDQQMWSDYLNALNYKSRIVKNSKNDSLIANNNSKLLENVLNPLVDELQKKYSNKIFINTELFNEIKLSRIDMAVTYVNSPFAQVVPGFPILTTDHKLNYGKKYN